MYVLHLLGCVGLPRTRFPKYAGSLLVSAEVYLGRAIAAELNQISTGPDKVYPCSCGGAHVPIDSMRVRAVTMHEEDGCEANERTT